MLLSGNNRAFILGLLTVGAVVVLGLRYRRQYESNIPLLFYGALFTLVDALESNLQLGIIYAGAALTLLLRFEFMNAAFTKVFQSLELVVLALIIYQCAASF